MSKKYRFGVIGCGLMGREFASVAARWLHGMEDAPVPEIVAVCDTNPAATEWFQKNIPSVVFATNDYKELLAREDVDCVYCAVPHNLHEQVYIDIIRAGKHLLGEKPFGIDQKANEAILKEIKAHPEVFVRCASEFPFFPACQRLVRWIQEGKPGRIMEVKAGFNHCSDMDLTKPINWKRMLEFNGEYGCLGDLGLHTQHIPIRLGWIPEKVYACFSNIAEERPDGKGGMAKCETWDNATLCCQVEKDGYKFPMFLETKRMQPCATNEWYIEVIGLEESARFSTEDPNVFWYTQSQGKNQAWCRLNIGYQPQFRTITGDIFEFGFSDSILQMWIAFMLELEGKEVAFGTVRPEETAVYHKVATAALKSHAKGKAIEL